MVSQRSTLGGTNFDMAKQIPQQGILVVDPKGITLYSIGLPTGHRVPFQDGCLSDMEIVNKETCGTAFQTLFSSLPGPLAEVLIVIAPDLSFEKQLGVIADDKKEEVLQDFLLQTPFDRVAGRMYRLSSGARAVSINRDFYDHLRQILRRYEIPVVGAVPFFLVASFFQNGTMNAKSLKLFIARFESFKDQSIVAERGLPKTLQEKEEYYSKQYSVPLIIGLILFLLLVFGLTGYIMKSQFDAARKPSATLMPEDSTIAEPTPSPLTEVILPQDASPTSRLRLLIRHGNSTATIAASLARTLQPIAQGEQRRDSTIPAGQPAAFFRVGVDPTMKASASAVIREFLPRVTIQDTADAAVDLQILTGN